MSRSKFCCRHSIIYREHLVTLDHLRQVIGWRGYAQRDPLNEYKSEAFELFDELIGNLREHVTSQLMRIEVNVTPQPLQPVIGEGHHADPVTGENEEELAGLAFQKAIHPSPVKRADGRVGRNDPCPCGSGKKYKFCHGALK